MSFSWVRFSSSLFFPFFHFFLGAGFRTACCQEILVSPPYSHNVLVTSRPYIFFFRVIILPSKFCVKSFLAFSRLLKGFRRLIRMYHSSPLVSSWHWAKMTSFIMQTPWTAPKELNERSWILDELAMAWIPKALEGLMSARTWRTVKLQGLLAIPASILASL